MATRRRLIKFKSIITSTVHAPGKFTGPHFFESKFSYISNFYSPFPSHSPPSAAVPRPQEHGRPEPDNSDPAQAQGDQGAGEEALFVHLQQDGQGEREGGRPDPEEAVRSHGPVLGGRVERRGGRRDQERGDGEDHDARQSQLHRQALNCWFTLRYCASLFLWFGCNT